MSCHVSRVERPTPTPTPCTAAAAAAAEAVEEGPGGQLRDSRALELSSTTLTTSAGGNGRAVESDRLVVEAEAVVAGEGAAVQVRGSATLQHRGGSGSSSASRGEAEFTEWPVLFEGDGGR